jgi:hypothetical protein
MACFVSSERTLASSISGRFTPFWQLATGELAMCSKGEWGVEELAGAEGQGGGEGREGVGVLYPRRVFSNAGVSPAARRRPISVCHRLYREEMRELRVYPGSKWSGSDLDLFVYGSAHYPISNKI